MSDDIEYRVMVSKKGSKYWFLGAELHNEHGAAVEWADGTKHWYLNDIRYTESDYKEEMERRKNSLDGKIATIAGKVYTLTKVK
tara:strand:- start:254 stop:505 length:252 start_codon:yes stop_codon:yes gene_type:complete